MYRWRRPDTRSILVNAHSTMELPVVAPLYEHMKRDERVKFYFTSTNEPTRVREIFHEAGADARVIHPRRAAMMKFDACLATDMPSGWLPRGTTRIQMFHGVAGKYASFIDMPTRSMRHWDRVFFINQKRMSNWIRCGAIDADSPAIRLVGMPKIDCIVDGTFKRDEVLRAHNLDSARRTVLYAPTWSEHSSLNAMGEELIKQLVKSNYTVIVKLHENSRVQRQTHSGGVDWVARLESLLSAHGGLLASDSNACPYLVAADCLITDHSSIGFEYLLLDRPVIRIESPMLLKHAGVNPEYVELLKRAAHTVHTPAEAATAVADNFAQPNANSAARVAIADELFYKPGTATERAVRELYDIIELDVPASVLTKTPTLTSSTSFSMSV